MVLIADYVGDNGKQQNRVNKIVALFSFDIHIWGILIDLRLDKFQLEIIDG